MRLAISQHAVNRYRERFGSIKPDSSIVDKLRGLWKRGEPMTRKGPSVVMEFFTHGSISEWRHSRGVIMIVSENVMITVVRRNKNHKPMFRKPRKN